jgi:hypothetical protein
LLNIWRAIHTAADRPRSMNELKKFCRQHFLSFRRIREWRDIHRQITAVLKEQDNGRRWKGPGLPDDRRRPARIATARSTRCMPPFTGRS